MVTYHEEQNANADQIRYRLSKQLESAISSERGRVVIAGGMVGDYPEVLIENKTFHVTLIVKEQIVHEQ